MTGRLLDIILLSSSLLTLVVSDNLGTLSGSARRLERLSCEESSVSLTCPERTSISLVEARYEAEPGLRQLLGCPGTSEPLPATSSLCNLTSVLQYSLLQTVVEACQKKWSCKLQPDPSTFSTDPCPALSKTIRIVYKCIPYEFRSKVACENDIVELRCKPNTRLAVFSASYGRTQYESLQCPQTQGVPEETCLASYATETVLSLCHGKRSCLLSADTSTFGSPCTKESRMYLKVVYTCVPLGVLKSEFEESVGEDESGPAQEEGTFNYYDSSGGASSRHNSSVNQSTISYQYENSTEPAYWPTFGDQLTGKVRRRVDESELVSKAEGRVGGEGPILVNCTLNIITEGKPLVFGFLSQWIASYHFLTKNKERLILYLAVSMGGGLVCLLCILTVKLAWSRRSSKPVDGSSRGPQPFAEELSESEIDLRNRTALPIRQTEVVRYSGLQERDPSGERSLLRSPPSEYYYG